MASSSEPFSTVSTSHRAVDRCAVAVLCYVNYVTKTFVATNRQPNNQNFYYLVSIFAEFNKNRWRLNVCTNPWALSSQRNSGQQHRLVHLGMYKALNINIFSEILKSAACVFYVTVVIFFSLGGCYVTHNTESHWNKHRILQRWQQQQSTIEVRRSYKSVHSTS